MPTTTLAGREIQVDDEGFMTQYDQWDDALGAELARLIGVEMTESAWAAVHFLREDYATTHVTATLRRVSTVGGFDIKALFVLFPKKPAKKMAYIAGLPKPAGCV